MFRILQFIARHSTVFMPLAALVGFALPDVAQAVLPFLPEILFFLMFFTLLGINQQALIRKLFAASVWRFAFLQTGGFCLITTALAYVLGARGDLLLAFAALGTTAPLFGSGAIVNALGYDALEAMARTICATLLMPLFLLIVLAVFAQEGATVDFVLYTQRLLIYIVAPIGLAFLVRRHLPSQWLTRIYPKVAQCNILLLLCFPLGLIAGFRQLFDADASYSLFLLLLITLASLMYFVGAYCLYRRFGVESAISAAVVNAMRNVTLTYIIAAPFLGSVFLPLAGVLQLPMFSLPALAKWLAKKQQQAT